ncbi:hypothetical protein TB1_004228 [Malus domestica]
MPKSLRGWEEPQPHLGSCWGQMGEVGAGPARRWPWVAWERKPNQLGWFNMLRARAKKSKPSKRIALLVSQAKLQVVLGASSSSKLPHAEA